MGHGGEGAGFAATGTAIFKVQEDGKGRYFEMGSATLPRRIYYYFDRDNLVLDVGEGPPKGPLVFTRASPSSRPWVIGGVLLAIVVLTVAAILLRSRMKIAAEPRAAEDRPRAGGPPSSTAPPA
jgi:hypothetical protein